MLPLFFSSNRVLRLYLYVILEKAKRINEAHQQHQYIQQKTLKIEEEKLKYWRKAVEKYCESKGKKLESSSSSSEELEEVNFI